MRHDPLPASCGPRLGVPPPRGPDGEAEAEEGHRTAAGWGHGAQIRHCSRCRARGRPGDRPPSLRSETEGHRGVWSHVPVFRSPCAPSPEIHRTEGPSATTRGRQTRDQSSPWHGARNRSHTGPAHLHRPASPLRKLPEEALGQNEGRTKRKREDTVTTNPALTRDKESLASLQGSVAFRGQARRARRAGRPVWAQGTAP